MSGGLQRWMAVLACRVLQTILPASLQSWGQAVRCETAAIPDDAQALRFALDSLLGLLPRAVLTRLHQAFATLMHECTLDSVDAARMNRNSPARLGPRAVGMACATGAVTLGLAYLGMAGAPALYLGVNAGALIIGLTVLALVQRTSAAGLPVATGLIPVIACVLLSTALLGDRAVGAARWVTLGGLSLQPSLVLLPLMLVAFVRTRSSVATGAIIATALAMALQPDRAMAGMMAASLAVLATIRFDKHVAAALLASALGFAATLLREDTLPAVAYVDEVLYSAFDLHPAAGVAVHAGSVLLLVPAIVGWRRDPANRATYAIFGAAWFVAILAAALGNYPTPLVGYGGSAILGYALSLLSLPKTATAPASERPRTVDEASSPPDQHLLVGLA